MEYVAYLIEPINGRTECDPVTGTFPSERNTLFKTITSNWEGAVLRRLSPSKIYPYTLAAISSLKPVAAHLRLTRYYADRLIRSGKWKIAMRLDDIVESILYFNKFDMFTVINAQRQSAEKYIKELNADVLLNTPVDDVVEQVIERFGFDIPVLLRNEAHLEEPREVTLTVQDFGRTIHPLGTMLKLVVPFTGDASMFWVRPTQFNSAPPRGNLQNNTIVLTMKGMNLEQTQVTNTFQKTLDEFDLYFGWQRENAKQLEQTLRQSSIAAINARRSRLLADRNLVANLPFKIKARNDVAPTYTAPVQRKKIATQQVQTSPAFKPEPVLTEADYQHIITMIDGMTKTMERSPTTFAKLDEEALRDMYLVPLNAHFEGSATGETFNASGKTDILIRVGDRNIFIAECKIWRGAAYLKEAIDQLLSYLTWRDTKAAIIIFSRNKGLSGVLQSVQETIANYPNRKSGPTVQGETKFRYVFGNPTDEKREIIVTVMVFDVPTA